VFDVKVSRRRASRRRLITIIICRDAVISTAFFKIMREKRVGPNVTGVKRLVGTYLKLLDTYCSMQFIKILDTPSYLQFINSNHLPYQRRRQSVVVVSIVDFRIHNRISLLGYCKVQQVTQQTRRIHTMDTTNKDTKQAASVSPSQEQTEHYHEDKDEENPCAVRVAGMNSMDSPAVQEDALAMEIEDSTSRMEDGMRNEAVSTRMVLEAKLVAEDDEREQMKVAQAEVVEDDGSKPRRRALLCAAMVVILSAIILGVVLGTRDNTSPTIVDNDSCDNAFGPINRAEIIPGSTSNGATVDIEAPSCGSASKPTAPGVWYNITGDGGIITLSTCGTKTDFDSQISVFTGSCDELMCVDAIDNACGSQSRLEFESIRNEPYHVLVHGLGNSSGSFDLQIVFTRLVTFSDLFVKYNVSSQALQDRSSPQYEALEWMAYSDSTTLQSALSDNELVERFALVLLYFATGGRTWLDQAGFLTPLNTCSWNSIVDATARDIKVGFDCNEGCTRELGVECNEGSVVTLDLCKFPTSST
jgi:hypothetical protein